MLLSVRQDLQSPQLHRLGAHVPQGIPDAVTALAWHPGQAHMLALGCSSGAVAVLDTQKGALLL